MTDELDVDPEELIDQHKDETKGGHSQTEAVVEQTDADDTPALEEAIADAYEQIDKGDVSSNLTLRDENLAALFHGLENTNRLADVGERAADELDKDPDDTETRAATLRLLVRIGLQAVDDEEAGIIQSATDGRNQYYQSDEF